MGPDEAISIGEKALMITLTLALPLLVVGLVVGVVISIVQAVTQIQEQTLVFIPKIVGIVAVLAITGPWMLNEMVTYTETLFQSIPELVGKQ